MADFQIQSLDNLTQDQVDAAYSLIVQMVQEKNPNIDVKRGAVKDLVLLLSAEFAAVNKANIDLVRQSNSLLAISQNPSLSDPALVNAVASNFNTTRIAGTVAKGFATIILNAAKVITISLNTQFITNTGLIFLADNSYTSRLSSGQVTSSTDRLLITLGNGLYAFTVGLVSIAIGAQYHVVQNTAFIPPLLDPSIVSAYATNDFIGGTDSETNTALINRLPSSIGAKTLSNRTGIEGLIRSLDLPSYDSSFAVSTVGYLDGEQQRYHSILPVSFGGRVDVYVRTQSTVQTVGLVKQAVYIGPDINNKGIWQISFTRNDIPGMYKVTRVTLPANIANNSIASYNINTDTRNFDLSIGSTAGTIYFPDITKGSEAVYSRYQTCLLTFTDTDTAIGGLVANVSTANYGIHAYTLPGVELIQDLVSDINNRLPISDCLIKLPIPCFVSVAVTLGQTATAQTLDIASIQATVADSVNTIGFTGKIPSSNIITAIHNLVGNNAVVSNIIVQGSIRRVDGTIINLSSSTVLDIGTDAANLVTAKTVGFFLSPSDVTINVAIS